MMFKVGDKVRLKVGSFVSEYSIFGLSNEALCKESEYELGKVYTVAKISGNGGILLNVEELLENCYIDCFELAFPPLPDLRDLASVVKPTPFDWATSYDSVPILPQLKSGLAKMWNGKEWEWIKNPVSATPTTTTKIIHNGTTTITMFSDDSKIITRPSEADADKFDPFIGWCVGVVEKLYGGKEKAKRFYKEHAVVQKCMRKVEEPADWNEVVETVKVEKARKDCDNCKHHNSSVSGEQCRQCLEDYSQGMLVTKWEPKEQKC